MNFATRKKTNTAARVLSILLLTMIAMTTQVWGQLPVPSSSQFDITGFIQTATLGGPGTGVAPAHTRAASSPSTDMW